MQALVRPFLIALLAWPILAGCTRERPTPEPTATAAIVGSSTAAPAAPAAGAPAAAPTSSTPSSEAGLVVGTPAVTPSPSPTSQQTFLYVVQAGDSLSGIALRFGTTLEVLRQLNNLSGDTLIVGQPIYVPYIEGMTAEGMPTPTPGPFYYTVQPGDTYRGIGDRFCVDAITVQAFNEAGGPEHVLQPCDRVQLRPTSRTIAAQG